MLSEGVDVNTLDYKGATPLHRAKDAATVEVCAINTSWSSLTSKSVYSDNKAESDGLEKRVVIE